MEVNETSLVKKLDGLLNDVWDDRFCFGILQ
jgi:hypothetical protein